MKKGYKGSSIDDLTEALGINRPSLYAAFGNKQKLFVTVLTRYHARYRDYFESLMARGLSPKETVNEWLSWFLDFYRTQEESMGCLIVNSTMLVNDEYPEISAELKAFHDLNEKLLSEYLLSEKEAGRFSGDPAASSQFYNAVVQGMAVLHRSGRDFSVLENVASNAMNAWPE